MNPDLLAATLKHAEELQDLTCAIEEQRISSILTAYTSAYEVFQKNYPQRADSDAHAFAMQITELYVGAANAAHRR